MKSVLITGASSGLGEAMAREFASRGYALALTARRVEKLEQLQRELGGISPKVVIRQLDVTDYDQVSPVMESLAAELGGLDIVVVNSGVGSEHRVGTDDMVTVKNTIDTNVTAAIATIDAAVRIFQVQGHGHLVGISSFAAVRGMPGAGVYSASKAAVARYLQSARLENLKKNITVTDLAPGYIDTDLNRDIPKRPFVIPVEKGGKILVDKIERKVSFSFVPAWPWRLVAAFIRNAPTRFLAE